MGLKKVVKRNSLSSVYTNIYLTVYIYLLIYNMLSHTQTYKHTHIYIIFCHIKQRLKILENRKETNIVIPSEQNLWFEKELMLQNCCQLSCLPFSFLCKRKGSIDKWWTWKTRECVYSSSCTRNDIFFSHAQISFISLCAYSICIYEIVSQKKWMMIDAFFTCFNNENLYVIYPQWILI